MAKSVKQHDAAIMRMLNATTPKKLGAGVIASIGIGNPGVQGAPIFYWSIKAKQWRASSTFYKRLPDAERGLERFLRKVGCAKEAEQWLKVKKTSPAHLLL